MKLLSALYTHIGRRTYRRGSWCLRWKPACFKIDRKLWNVCNCEPATSAEATLDSCFISCVCATQRAKLDVPFVLMVRQCSKCGEKENAHKSKNRTIRRIKQEWQLCPRKSKQYATYHILDVLWNVLMRKFASESNSVPWRITSDSCGQRCSVTFIYAM